METNTLVFRQISLLVLLSIMINSCRQNVIEPIIDKGSDENTFQKELSSRNANIIYRGIYIDGFSDKLGIDSREDSLLNWCLANNFNEISLYGMNVILSSNSLTIKLNNFISKANGLPYTIKVSVVAASLNSTINEYNNYYLLYPNKFSGITTEYEFWNTGNSYNTFQNQILYLTTINNNTSGAIKRQIYISKFKDASNPALADTTIAEQLVSNVDRFFLVNYTTNSYNLSNTTLNKIKLIANASRKLNKVSDVVILFNLNQTSVDPNIYNYFSVTGSNHLFSDAFAKFNADYNAVVFSNKAYINLIGFQLYNYTSAHNARP